MRTLRFWRFSVPPRENVMAKRLRKKHWIDSQIQGALAIRIFLHWLVFGCIATILTLMMQYMENPFSSLSYHLEELWNNQSAFGLVMLILLPIFVYDSVKLSNRFAGPIYRIRKAMKQVGEGGKPEKIAFRSGDFWAGLAEDYNSMIDRGIFDHLDDEADYDNDEEDLPQTIVAEVKPVTAITQPEVQPEVQTEAELQETV